MSLGVLAFFKSVIQSLIELSDSLKIKYCLEDLDASVEKAVNILIKKHEENLPAYKFIEKSLEEDTVSYVISGLRMFLYFGDENEVINVARLLPILAKFGIYDKYLTKGLKFYSKKESLSQEQKKVIINVIERL